MYSEMIKIIVQVFLKKISRWCIDNVRWQVVPVINASNRKVITSDQSLSMGLKYLVIMSTNYTARTELEKFIWNIK